MHDKRRHPRYPVNAEFAAVHEYIAEYASNLGRGGVFIRSRHMQPIGTPVTLSFSLFLDDFELFEGQGIVKYVVDTGTVSGMGIEFTELTEASSALIDRVAALNGGR